MTQKVRLSPDERKDVIIDAAMRLVERDSVDLLTITREQIAGACRVATSPDTVKHYFKMPELRNAVSDRINARK